MAGTLFENNLSPYLTIVEATEPSAPSAGQQRLYIDSTTHLLKATNSSGTDRTIEGVPAGAVTTSGLTMATAKMLGRSTASTGAIEEITVGTGLSLAAGSLTATGVGSGFAQSAIATRTAGDLTTTSTTFVDMTGMSITITTGATRCIVFFSGNVKNSGSSTVAVTLDIDGSNQGQTFGLIFIDSLPSNGAAPVGFTFLTGVLSAASHTFKIQWRVAAGTGTVWASTGVTPIIMTVMETNLTT